MATTLMVNTRVCKSSHATTEGNQCKALKQHQRRKPKVKTISEQVDVGTCKNFQAKPMTLKARSKM
jgi:hypothetical protein